MSNRLRFGTTNTFFLLLLRVYPVSRCALKRVWPLLAVAQKKLITFPLYSPSPVNFGLQNFCRPIVGVRQNNKRFFDESSRPNVIKNFEFFRKVMLACKAGSRDVCACACVCVFFHLFVVTIPPIKARRGLHFAVY